MAHFHLCWELGGGLGHAGRLKIIADALLARGHRVSLGLHDLVQTHGMLTGLNVPMLQAPVWLHKVEGMPANHGSLAEILLSAGYLDADALAGLVAGWRAMFRQLGPDLVVADYAPTAVLAARSLGLRSVAVGAAFAMPPAGRALPCLRPWEAIAPQRLAMAEERVLRVANAVLSRHGAPPLAWAADLLLGDVPLLTSWPELDPYGRPAGAAPQASDASQTSHALNASQSASQAALPSAAPSSPSSPAAASVPQASPDARVVAAAGGRRFTAQPVLVQPSSLRPSVIRLGTAHAAGPAFPLASPQAAAPSFVHAAVPAFADAAAPAKVRHDSSGARQALDAVSPDNAGAAQSGAQSWYGPAFFPGSGEAPAWPPGGGPKVFAYLKAGHAACADVLAALALQGCRVLCYLPEVASGKAPPVEALNIAYAPRPVALRAALAEAQLCVTHAGEATLAQAMLAGVPVLMLPMQLEQFLVAQRVAAFGMGLNTAMLAQPVDWPHVVRHMLATPGYGAAASAFAQSNRSYTAEGAAARLAVALESALDAPPP